MVRELEDSRVEDLTNFHLAGIIPLCGQQYKQSGLEWHPALLPIDDNVTLIDQAVMQCAWAGCNTIWIVIEDHLEPLFRQRIGEYLEDPQFYKLKKFGKYRFPMHKKIPIYWIPDSLYDRDRRDSVSWQVIRGAEMARKISGQLTSFVMPDRFYVTFPYSVMYPGAVKFFRSDLSSHSDIIFTHEGKSIRTDHYMPFTITFKDLKQCKSWVWHNSTGTRDMSQPKEEWKFGSIPTKKLPAAEQYSARWFGPEKVFEAYHSKDEIREKELKWFYDCSTFEGYREYMGSDKHVRQWGKELFIGKKWESMSFDDDEFEEDT